MKKNFIIGMMLAFSLNAWAEEETLPDFKTRQGIEYKDAVVTGGTAAAIKIIHADGVATVLLSDLPDDLQERFGYNPDQAKRLLQDEANAKAAAAMANRKKVEEKNRAQENRKNSATFTVEVYSVREDGAIVVSRGYRWGIGKSDDEQNQLAERLRDKEMLMTGLTDIADGQEYEVLAYPDGTIRLDGHRTLEKWVSIEVIERRK